MRFVWPATIDAIHARKYTAAIGQKNIKTYPAYRVLRCDSGGAIIMMAPTIATSVTKIAGANLDLNLRLIQTPMTIATISLAPVDIPTKVDCRVVKPKLRNRMRQNTSTVRSGHAYPLTMIAPNDVTPPFGTPEVKSPKKTQYKRGSRRASLT